MKSNCFPDEGLTPRNKAAALMFAKGEKRETGVITENMPHWDLPPPTIPTPAGMDFLTATKFGRLTVMGVYQHKGGKYLVQCSCGDYETRSAYAITQAEDRNGDRCRLCYNIAKAKSYQDFVKTGQWKNWTQF